MNSKNIETKAKSEVVKETKPINLQYRGRDVKVLRPAQKGDEGWGSEDGRVIVEYTDGHTESVKGHEVLPV